jgi:hypothetical protein
LLVEHHRATEILYDPLAILVQEAEPGAAAPVAAGARQLEELGGALVVPGQRAAAGAIFRSEVGATERITNGAGLRPGALPPLQARS